MEGNPQLGHAKILKGFQQGLFTLILASERKGNVLPVYMFPRNNSVCIGFLSLVTHGLLSGEERCYVNYKEPWLIFINVDGFCWLSIMSNFVLFVIILVKLG